MAKILPFKSKSLDTMNSLTEVLIKAYLKSGGEFYSGEGVTSMPALETALDQAVGFLRSGYRPTDSKSEIRYKSLCSTVERVENFIRTVNKNLTY